MEDMDFGRTSIYEATTMSVDISTAILSDKSTEISIDDAHQTSIDSTPPEAGKYSLTDDANERNQFGIYQIDDDTLSELEQQIDFVDSETLKNNYPNPDSFTQNYDATVGSRQGRAKSRLNQAFTGNRKLATDLNGKIDLIFSDLTRKFDALSEHIKRLDSRVAENATAIKRET
ncbi:hypothetical protein F2Q68_00015581 [Brassica cretica]|uniref:Uncharacterized protein n=1 Tax=Brassica cretica TaxID=69181 RepID=A0A8S9HEJ1_BRACR|nr:hypothetical protein F2Q68_00015581 [Brassica cretica]